jgi:hypothetical protein
VARLFVYSDNLAARVELCEGTDGVTAAFCAGCSRGSEDGIDLLADTHERFHAEDAQQVAAIHVDRCKRCAHEQCLVQKPHGAGRRCLRPDLI